VITVLLLYVASLVWLDGWLETFEDTHPAGILLAYAPRTFAIAPLPVVAVVAVLQGRLALGCAVLVGTAWMVRRLLGWQPARATSQRRGMLRVVSYNTYGGSLGALRAAQAAAALDADILFVQEAWWALDKDGGKAPGASPDKDTFVHLERLLEGYFSARSDARYELAIFSRYPLHEVEQWELDETRKCLTCVIKVGDRRVRLVNVHIEPPVMPDQLGPGKPSLAAQLQRRSRMRRCQAEALKRHLERTDFVCLVAGDFNSPPSSVVRRAIPSTFRDSFREAGEGLAYTFPQRLPLWRLDYVLARGPWKILTHRLVATPASDHLPIVAELDLRDEG
jgi:endonuclease/exonuclease/phosphatase (EEP) superfamily protein YafD